MTNETVSAEFFENLYQGEEDPWAFSKSEYELNRYESIIRFLNGGRFKRGFEPGCSVGVLTEKLASLCDRLEAIDIAPSAVQRARLRCQYLANVSIYQGMLPNDLPDGTIDLVVFSEIGYYFETGVLRNLVRDLIDRLESGGTFLAAHWLGTSPDHLLSGDAVHVVLNSFPELLHKSSERQSGFRIDVWSKA